MFSWLLQPRGRHESGDTPVPRRRERDAADRVAARLAHHDAQLDGLYAWMWAICQEAGLKAHPPLRALQDEDAS
jgi:hypothetical protein